MAISNHILIILIKIYRGFISPVLPASCRFYPTCSEYSLAAYKNFGFFKATGLTIKRIVKCHPFHPGGYDPLPPHKEIKNG
jgi:putative membrane protein insertion efficiency factor